MKSTIKAVIQGTVYRALESITIIAILVAFVYFIISAMGRLDQIRLAEGYLEAVSTTQIATTATSYTTAAPPKTDTPDKTALESDTAQQLFNP